MSISTNQSAKLYKINGRVIFDELQPSVREVRKIIPFRLKDKIIYKGQSLQLQTKREDKFTLFITDLEEEVETDSDNDELVTRCVNSGIIVKDTKLGLEFFNCEPRIIPIDEMYEDMDFINWLISCTQKDIREVYDVYQSTLATE